MSNLDHPANRLLTDAGPSKPVGSPEGSPLDQLSQSQPSSEQPASGPRTVADPPEAGSPRDRQTDGLTAASGSEPPPKPVPAKAAAPETPDAALRAHLNGEPDTLPITWCPNCQADVKPKGKGFCPRCGRMLKGSFLSRKHPVNVLRRDALLAKLMADYEPRTTLLVSACYTLAGVLEQLETLKAGSQEHKRLVDLSVTLGAQLEESRPQIIATSDSDGVPPRIVRIIIDPVHEQLDALQQRVQQGDALSEYDRGRFDALRAVHDARQVAAVRDPRAAPGDMPQVDERLDDSRQSDSTCPYCRQPLDQCAAMKEQRLDDWRALHWSEPSEIDRRVEEATTVMFATMRHGSGITRW